jgi:hypothetical protein
MNYLLLFLFIVVLYFINSHNKIEYFDAIPMENPTRFLGQKKYTGKLDENSGYMREFNNLRIVKQLEGQMIDLNNAVIDNTKIRPEDTIEVLKTQNPTIVKNGKNLKDDIITIADENRVMAKKVNKVHKKYVAKKSEHESKKTEHDKVIANYKTAKKEMKKRKDAMEKKYEEDAAKAKAKAKNKSKK